MLLPALIIALGGWREPLVLADVLGDHGIALREQTIAFFVDRLRAPHFEPTNRLRYWLAYADDRQAAALYKEAATVTQPQRKLDASTRAYIHMSQASFLTHEFGLDDRSDWIGEALALGGRFEFITPYVSYIEEHATGSAWRERTWLARIDPSTLSDLQTRFARERPGDSFDALWTSTFDDGMALPEGTLTTTDGERLDVRRSRTAVWTAVLVWSRACAGCVADLERFDALAREFPDRVMAITADGDAESARLFLADHGLTVPAAVVDRTFLEQLRAEPGAKLVISPRALFVQLRGERWEADARHALAVK